MILKKDLLKSRSFFLYPDKQCARNRKVPGVDDHVLLNGGIEIPVTAAVHGPVGAGLQEPETLRRAYRPGFFLVVRLNLPGVVAVGPVLVGL